jgi:hypothetical protein
MVDEELKKYLADKLQTYYIEHPKYCQELNQELIDWNGEMMGQKEVPERMLAMVSLQAGRRNQTGRKFIDDLVSKETVESFMKHLTGN